MLLTVLGAGGSYPPPGYGGPSLLIDTGRDRIALDCGDDCITGLTLGGYKPCDVDTVFISHIHIDHWSGLFQLSVAKIAEGCPSIRIVAGGEVLEALERTLPALLPRSIKMVFLEPGLLNMGELGARVFPVSHTVPAYGITLSIDGEKLLSYTGDTRMEDSLSEAVKDSSILVAEATLPSRLAEVASREGHMTVRDFMDLIDRTRPRYGIAVHLSPESLAELRSILANGSNPLGILIGSRGLQISL